MRTSASLEEVLDLLHAAARPDQLEGMARFGIVPDRRLAVSAPDLKRIARSAGKGHALALALWNTGIPDAWLLAALIDEPAKVTVRQMERWVKDFHSWDVCDGLCLHLFVLTPHAWPMAVAWAKREEEFVRRAGFVLMACLAVHDRHAGDGKFMRLFPLIRRFSTDERNFVRKAVNWALRQIGKRSPGLHAAALRVAREIRTMDSRAARWIATDALRELERTPPRRQGHGLR
jgi:3-methyladenine DNA glycosylase AlkD